MVFAIDRAGLVGSDGETHQGIFDLSYLSTIPNMSILAPKNKWELSDMMKFAVNFGHPIAIRYPRGKETARQVYEMLKSMGYFCSLINVRFVKPLDTELLEELLENHDFFVTMEENVKSGGFGEHVAQYFNENHAEQMPKIEYVAAPDVYVEHGNVNILKKELGLDAESVVKRIVAAYKRKVIT